MSNHYSAKKTKQGYAGNLQSSRMACV